MCDKNCSFMSFLLYFCAECTNGEWNTLRCRGNTHPLSLLQIRANARAKYSRMPKGTMVSMLTPIRKGGVTCMIYRHVSKQC